MFYFFGQLSFPNIVLAINMPLEDVALHAGCEVLIEFDDNWDFRLVDKAS